MSVRSTSKIAYQDLIDRDVLGKKHIEVMTAMIAADMAGYGSVTASELFNEYLKGYNMVFSNVRSRLSELRDMGAIAEGEKRLCAYTNRVVLTWRLTGEKPQKITRVSKAVRKNMVKDRLSILYADLSGNNKAREDLKVIWSMVKEL